MKRLRALLVLLLVIALPCSALADLRDNLQCHHDGLGILFEQQAPAAGLHHHAPAADPDCDCAVKCDCQHHCASGGGTALLGLTAPTISLTAGDQAAIAYDAAGLSSMRGGSRFRPPIAAPPGAA